VALIGTTAEPTIYLPVRVSPSPAFWVRVAEEGASIGDVVALLPTRLGIGKGQLSGQEALSYTFRAESAHKVPS